jgi:hypothetical protein
MEWLGESLGIKDPKDWYQVFYKRICNLSGSTVLHRLKGISGLLHKAFPEIQWDDKAFTASRSVLKSQVYLIKVHSLINSYMFSSFIHSLICSFGR